MPALFVSDLHLHPSRPETARLFRDFLSGPARSAQALFILGDLFDAWAGDDELGNSGDPFYAGLCAALRALADDGVPISFLPGNRDFLAGAGFAAATGAKLLADETVADIGGLPALLLHGDTLCTDDREYQAFRDTVRSDKWRRDFLAQPLAERHAEVEALRARSEEEKRVKPMALMDVSEAAVAKAFERWNVTRIIHGHTHRAAHHTYADGRERWVLPEWGTAGGFLACDASGCRLLTFPAVT